MELALVGNVQIHPTHIDRVLQCDLQFYSMNRNKSKDDKPCIFSIKAWHDGKYHGFLKGNVAQSDGDARQRRRGKMNKTGRVDVPDRNFG